MTWGAPNDAAAAGVASTEADRRAGASAGTTVPPERPPRPAGRQAAHVADTRRALLDAARALFGTRGFRATRTEEIVRRAGLTRGALYHHFAGKEELFRAVHEELADEVAQSLRRRSSEGRPTRGADGGSGATDAWDLFRANNAIYLEAASGNRPYRQIVLIDGPAVLGTGAGDASQRGPTTKIAEYVRQAMDEGVLEPQPVDALAHLLSALGTGGVMYVAHAEDPVAARDDVERCTEQLLSGLLARSDGAERAGRARDHGGEGRRHDHGGEGRPSRKGRE